MKVAERYLKHQMANTVAPVSAYFTDKQRLATMYASHNAGSEPELSANEWIIKSPNINLWYASHGLADNSKNIQARVVKSVGYCITLSIA